MYLHTTDGQTVHANVLGTQGDDVRLEVYVGGGKMVETRKMAAFDQESQFMIQHAVTPDTPDAYLKLAKSAIDAGLINSARRSLAKARSLAGDPSLGADIESSIGGRSVAVLEKHFEDDVKAGHTVDARRVLATLELRHGDAVPDQKRKAMQAEIDSILAQRKAAEAAREAAAETAREAKKRKQELEPAEHYLELAKRHRKTAMTSSAGSSEADDNYKRAVTDSQRALHDLDSLAKRHANDTELMSQLAPLRQDAQSTMVSSLMDGASVYMIHGRFNDAMTNVNRVLASNPTHEQEQRANAMRARMEMAANRGWRRW
jgi:hypothetical protein